MLDAGVRLHRQLARSGEIWYAQLVSHLGNHYVIKKADWDGYVGAGHSIRFGFNADWGADFGGPYNYVLNGVPISGW